MLPQSALGAIVIAETVALVIVAIGLGIALSRPATVVETPPTPPQTIGISRTSNAQNWVLTVITVPSQHYLTTTTFLMRWPTNQSVVTPPGQATLQTLKVVSGGVQYSPVSGAAQTDLRINDVIIISKAYTYTSGMTVSFSDGTTVLWSGTL